MSFIYLRKNYFIYLLNIKRNKNIDDDLTFHSINYIYIYIYQLKI